jgi:FixJ family two-component response regulator
MNGFELHSRLRELGYSLPIVFITAHDTPQTHAFVSQKGLAGLLLKPFSGSSLLAAVGQAMTP